MAILNQRTGYYGFTLSGTPGGAAIDKNGQVNRCIFSIVYPYQVTNVDFTISTGSDDWGAQMGDGTIIPLSNPTVLYTNRDNAIVQFDMTIVYPANSPCFLVYVNDTASFNVKPSSSSANPPFKPNAISGQFAFTTEGFGGSTDIHGRVNRLLATIPFPQQSSDVEFTISKDATHWGAHMGDGSIIALREPLVYTTNRDSAVVQFTMDEFYPSNSPCIIVYRSPDASISVKPKEDGGEFIPVTGIKGVPVTIPAGVTVDLSAVEVEPYDASVQGITWNVISGNATINGDSLLALSNGTIVLEGVIRGGINEGEADFTKRFTITASKNTIVIDAQPVPKLSLVVGSVDAVITVNARSDTNVLSYKWYRNSVSSVAGATAIPNTNKSSYQIPPTASKGDYYYFCEISSPGASTVRTDICHVTITNLLTGIQITPRPTSLAIGDEIQLGVDPIPADCDLPEIVWRSSDVNSIQIVNGKLTAINSGTITITAETVDGAHKDSIKINVPVFISVNNITGLPTDVDTGKPLTLTGTVVPENAAYKDITWSIVNDGGTETVLLNNIITASKPGTVRIKATIKKGISINQDFIKEFNVVVTKAFVPVSDITITGLDGEIRPGERFHISGTVTPTNATYNNIEFTVLVPGTTGATISDDTLTFTAAGDATIRATVKKGKSETENFSKDFPIRVLPAWIPVSEIQLEPEEFDPHHKGAEKVVLAYTVVPANSTRTDVIAKMIDPSVANCTFDPATNTLSVDPTKMTSDMNAVVEMELKVIDGYGKGKDFVVKHYIRVTPPAPPEVYVPVESVTLELPDPMRCAFPVLLNRAAIEPWNSNVKDLHWTPSRAQEYGGADTVWYFPKEYEHTHKLMDPRFDWDLDELYLFSFDPGKVKLDLIMYYGLGPYANEDFIKSFELTFLPPYIPVKDASNVPISIPCNQDIYLAAELETNGGTNYHNPTWDEEVPSWETIVWQLDNTHYDQIQYPNKAGAVLTKGAAFDTDVRGHNLYPFSVRASKTGEFWMQLTVNDGIKEDVMWYDKQLEGEAFHKMFKFTVVREEIPSANPIVTLTLNNGRKIEIKRIWDLYNLCNCLPSDFTLKIADNSFRKDEVTEVKFWDEVPVFDGEDSTIPISDISLRGNSTNVLKVDNKPVPSWDDVIPDNIPDGTVLVPYSPMGSSGARKLPGFVFLKPDGSIVKCYIETSTEVFYVNVHGAYVMNDSQDGSGQYKPGEIVTLYTDDPGASEKFNGWRIDAGSIIIEDPTNMSTRFIMPAEPVEVTAVWNDDTFIPHPGGGIIIPEPEPIEIKETVLNIGNYADAPFLVDGSKIAFDTLLVLGFEMYDNGYISIPAGCFLKENGSIIVNSSLDGDLSSVLPTIDIHGIIWDSFDESENGGNGRLPGGCKLGVGSIILGDGYGLNGEGFINPDDTDPLEIALPDGSTVITGIDGDLTIPCGDSITFANISKKQNGSIDYVQFNNGSVLIKDGHVLSSDGKYHHPTDNSAKGIILSDDTVTISPANATGKFDDIVWELNHYTHPDEPAENVSKLIQFPNGDRNIINVIVPGVVDEIVTIKATVENGIGWHGQNYIKTMHAVIGDPAPVSKVLAVNTNYDTLILFTAKWSQFINLSASALSMLSVDPASIQWSLSGNTSSDTKFSTNYYGGSNTDSGPNTTLRINRREKKDTVIKVTATVGGVSRTITIKLLDKYQDQPEIDTLRNFGRNFTNLRKIDRVPTMSGDDCYRNFLRGCTSFNQPIQIPEGVSGDRCMQYFMRDCVNFNSAINIPDSVTGNDCLHGFLYGCEKFNRPIVIPDGVSGDGCLERFLMKCKAFNQDITIPTNVNGKACLRDFLTECHAFNKPITIPTGIDGEFNMYQFMRDAKSMVSTVTIDYETAQKVQPNAQAFSSVYSAGPSIAAGIPIVGSGARLLMSKVTNYLSAPPYKHLITTEPELMSSDELIQSFAERSETDPAFTLDFTVPGPASTKTVDLNTVLFGNLEGNLKPQYIAYTVDSVDIINNEFKGKVEVTISNTNGNPKLSVEKASIWTANSLTESTRIAQITVTIESSNYESMYATFNVTFSQAVV